MAFILFIFVLAFADEFDMLAYLRKCVSRLWKKVKAISKAVCILFLSMEAVTDASGFVCLQVFLPAFVYSLKVSPLIEKISEHKDFKKLLRTRNNVLVLYSKSGKYSFSFLVSQPFVPSKVCVFDRVCVLLPVSMLRWWTPCSLLAPL